MLKKRITTALVLLPLGVLVALVGGWALTLVCFLLSIWLNYELYTGVLRIPQKLLLFGVGGNALLPLAFMLYGWTGFALMGIILVIAWLVRLILFVESEVHQPFVESLFPAVFVGVGYGGILIGQLPIVASFPQANWLMLWLLIVTVASDTFAYFGGRLLGGQKLASRISPNKTVSGAIVGLIFASTIGVVVLNDFNQCSVHWVLAVAFSFAVAVLLQLGDLAESLLKRAYGVKDTGNILPGHGGFLDRLDAFIFALPCLFILLI